MTSPHPDQQYSDDLDKILKQYSTDVQQGRAKIGLGVAKSAIAAREQRLLDRIGDEVIGANQEPGGYHGGDLNNRQDATIIANNIKNDLRNQQRTKLAAIRSKL